MNAQWSASNDQNFTITLHNVETLLNMPLHTPHKLLCLLKIFNQKRNFKIAVDFEAWKPKWDFSAYIFIFDLIFAESGIRIYRYIYLSYKELIL